MLISTCRKYDQYQDRENKTYSHAHFGDWHVKVQIKAQDRPREENDEHRERGVFEISQLNLHTPKLDPPTDGRIDGWRFEPHCLPISRLDVFEMIHRVLVVLIDSFAEDDQGVSDEEMSDMFGKSVVDS
jgi:hypothetical protein